MGKENFIYIIIIIYITFFSYVSPRTYFNWLLITDYLSPVFRGGARTSARGVVVFTIRDVEPRQPWRIPSPAVMKPAARENVENIFSHTFSMTYKKKIAVLCRRLQKVGMPKIVVVTLQCRSKHKDKFICSVNWGANSVNGQTQRLSKPESKQNH